jgi:tRNA U34 2-thiouridine synthase MnmA/TrmU
MKIAVAMSGGVDSSSAAALLKEQGHELVGFTMQLWNQRRHISVDENGDPLPSRCCSLDDVYDARRVAEKLGFPFYVLNLEKDFEQAVVLCGYEHRYYLRKRLAEQAPKENFILKEFSNYWRRRFRDESKLCKNSSKRT